MSEHGNPEKILNAEGKLEKWDQRHQIQSKILNAEVEKSYANEELERQERKLVKQLHLKPQQGSILQGSRQNGCFLGYSSLQNPVTGLYGCILAAD